MRLRRAEAEAKWRGLIAEQEQSGETVAQFCRERGIAASKLYLWKKRGLGAEADPGFVRLVVAPAVKPAWSGMPAGGIEVRLSNGRSLIVEPGFDASHLCALLTVLESRP